MIFELYTPVLHNEALKQRCPHLWQINKPIRHTFLDIAKIASNLPKILTFFHKFVIASLHQFEVLKE